MPGFAPAPAHHDAGPIPQWVIDSWTYSTQGTGRWVADNAAYQGADDPWDAFGIQWRWMPGKQAITGELFGISRAADGVERDSAPMWRFMSYWDPARQELVMTQFGGHGVFGVGKGQPPSGDHMDVVQTFYNPDGSSYRVAHRSWKDGTSNRQQSFDVDADGTWTPRREYVWVLTPRAG